MYIAIVGCAHGELETIYETVLKSEQHSGKKIDLLLCCGDFQATRNLVDLSCMAVSDKFKEMGTFYKYYSGEKVAPVLTLFVGGNHEASNHLQELSYGGWVAPNIYYLGYAGVVNIGGLRIAGISGIYKKHDYLKGHFERVPYNPSTLRSVYHISNLEVFRLKQLTGKIDIFMSHDWPEGVTSYGDVESLLKMKPFFREQINRNDLGSIPGQELLEHHQPSYWFAAHMHCKFSALIPEKNGSRLTKFLGLDKCLPKRSFLQVFEIEHEKDASLDLKYDLEWLSILYFTNHLLSVKKNFHYMPSNKDLDPANFALSNEDKEMILKRFNCNLNIPKNFCQNVEVFNPDIIQNRFQRPNLMTNHQTTEFCNTLGIDDPIALLKLIDPSFKNNQEKYSDNGDSLAASSSLEYSFVSDSISDSFSSDCFQVVIDKVSVENISNVKSSLSPMKLPAVSNDTCNDEEEKSIYKRNIETCKDLEEKKEDVENSEIKADEKVVPTVKKFKRRNESIYADTS